MFMAMKREVLRLGGYELEVFVSQTAELWTLADRVIDMAELRRAPESRVPALDHVPTSGAMTPGRVDVCAAR